LSKKYENNTRLGPTSSMISGKKKSIPLSWKIVKFIVKHITHLDELVGHHEQLGLKEAKSVEGFYPDNKFTAHMELVGYSSHFTKIE
jgi:hypothetical protein